MTILNFLDQDLLNLLPQLKLLESQPKCLRKQPLDLFVTFYKKSQKFGLSESFLQDLLKRAEKEFAFNPTGDNLRTTDLCRFLGDPVFVPTKVLNPSLENVTLDSALLSSQQEDSFFETETVRYFTDICKTAQLFEQKQKLLDIAFGIYFFNIQAVVIHCDDTEDTISDYWSTLAVRLITRQKALNTSLNRTNEFFNNNKDGFLVVYIPYIDVLFTTNTQKYFYNLQKNLRGSERFVETFAPLSPDFQWQPTVEASIKTFSSDLQDLWRQSLQTYQTRYKKDKGKQKTTRPIPIVRIEIKNTIKKANLGVEKQGTWAPFVVANRDLSELLDASISWAKAGVVNWTYPSPEVIRLMMSKSQNEDTNKAISDYFEKNIVKRVAYQYKENFLYQLDQVVELGLLSTTLSKEEIYGLNQLQLWISHLRLTIIKTHISVSDLERNFLLLKLQMELTKKKIMIKKRLQQSPN